MKYSSLFKLVGGPANGTRVKIRSDEQRVFPNRYEFAEYPNLSIKGPSSGAEPIKLNVKRHTYYIGQGHTYLYQEPVS